MWIGDVGMDNWEEVDFQPANDTGGQNYGWRCYEGDDTYNYSACSVTANFTFPIDTYGHSSINGCCIIGGYVYRGAQHKSLFGKYFYTDFCSGLFGSFKDSDGLYKKVLLNVLKKNQCVKFGQDIYGNLYVAEREPGKVFIIGDTTCAPVAFIAFKDTIYVGKDSSISALYGRGLTYQWRFNNRTISGNGNTVQVDSAGVYAVNVTNGTCSSSASVVVELTTGINRLQVFKALQIVPNPNNGVFNLNVSISKSTIATISISDVFGRQLLTENTGLYSGRNTIPILGKDFATGVYFLKLHTDKAEKVIKFVVNK